MGVLKDEWEKRHPSDTMECTPEKCPPVTPRPLGTVNAADPVPPPRLMVDRLDDPEEEDRQRRLAHIERRRAERG
ncbi:MAG: hypothetical protein H7841_08460, partial [Magnetospirillum sp. WYHS-4]